MTPHTTFKQQLRHWAFHVPIWALPSFIVMANVSEYRPGKIAVMLLGIALFTLIFTMLATLVTPLQPSRHLQKSILFASRLRSGLALLCVPGSLMGNIYLMLPDFCMGYLSLGITNSIIGHSASNDPFRSLFFATVVQGSLISLTFLLMVLGCFIAIQIAFQPMTHVRTDNHSEV